MSLTPFSTSPSSSLHECLVSAGCNLQQFTKQVASSRSHPFPGDLQCLPLSTWNNSSIIQHFSKSDLRVVAPWPWVHSHMEKERLCITSGPSKGLAAVQKSKKKSQEGRTVLCTSQSPPDMFLCLCGMTTKHFSTLQQLCPKEWGFDAWCVAIC